MKAYIDGDRRSFRTLHRRYEPRLFRMVRWRTSSEEIARELVQQTFLQVHRARFDFRGSSKVRPWLFTIALNLVREHYRRMGRRPKFLSEGDGEDAGYEPRVDPPDWIELEQRALEVRRVRRAIKLLPHPQREAIELHWIHGHSFPEVAEMVGASPSAVKVRAHRGYQRLRTLLAPA
ncbi:MAG: RNA polymerase sigma factor [Myxococcota bacterium]